MKVMLTKLAHWVEVTVFRLVQGSKYGPRGRDGS